MATEPVGVARTPPSAFVTPALSDGTPAASIALRAPAACHAAMLRCAAMLAFTPLLAAQAPRPLPPLAEATCIHDTKADAKRTWPELLDALAKVDAVFLGETHLDDTTHQVEQHVLEQLLAARHGKVVLSMEMFERDVQRVLDDYLAGRIDEATFLQRARPWQNYRTAYRPLIEAAKAAKIPVVAANFPGSLRRAFAGGGGKQALDALNPAQRALVPDEIFAASAAYWERVDRAVRGHMGGGGGGGTPEERRYETQNLWDNAMGDAVAKARAAHPDHAVLHVAGGFHVAYRDGTVAQFARRSPGSTFAVVSIAPTAELHLARPDRDREMADFVVYARTLARDLDEGNHAVDVPGELRYRLALPPNGAGWPLLVWLPARATRTADALAQWSAALGDGAAIAVIEAPFPEAQDDLAPGGRYAFGDGFRDDYGRVSDGLARIVEYVTRRLPVDAGRVVIAGEGDGGAAVLWTALYGEWLAAHMFALDPTDLRRLAMEGLPDQRPVARSLHLLARTTGAAALEAIAADYTKVGTPTKVTALAAGGPDLAGHVRQALGLPALEAPANTGEPLLLVLENDLPRAREWAALHEAQLRRGGRAASIVTAAEVPADTPAERLRRLTVGGDGAFPIASFAGGAGLPLAGGPFGGTTVVVLPRGVSDADRAAWLAHGENKVLKLRNRFANIAIAFSDGGPDVQQVVTGLQAKGRLRFLIVPAVFCADAPAMQALRAQLGKVAADLDVSWLPGLGAELASAPH